MWGGIAARITPGTPQRNIVQNNPFRFTAVHAKPLMALPCRETENAKNPNELCEPGFPLRSVKEVRLRKAGAGKALQNSVQARMGEIQCEPIWRRC